MAIVRLDEAKPSQAKLSQMPRKHEVKLGDTVREVGFGQQNLHQHCQYPTNLLKSGLHISTSRIQVVTWLVRIMARWRAAPPES